ncbi:carnitine O-palmitoyltransferase II, putative [Bodo saltans]|uniref:Carnitine O-palmitoyltransferase II, putative n=1 Tax=Bodo saltans TaxID=75058 RepID=A0A0S4JRH6_BODSA|nr:carnitine O-palmitoyltransferase II, putative [Bodo saltans]|eukprot:CUG92941.1 carnitine O-palmitoyltransferase II, putative [Bodo saltans]
MLRRSLVLASLPPAATPLVAPSNPSEWSDKGKKLLGEMRDGKCFDSSVLDKSVIPTKHLQYSLFRLPIPKLEDTCKRYLDSVKPIVSPASFDRTSKIVADFQQGLGKELHDTLVKTDKANQHTSYISGDWFDLYLSDRQPLPLNYNPSLITRNDPDKADHITRATFWIASSVRFYKAYIENTLKPEVFYFGSKKHYCRAPWFQKTVSLTPKKFSAKVMAIGSQFHAFPLDMSQNDNLFNSTRIPGVIKDELRASGFQPHIVVCYRGHQYILNVADSDCNPLSEEQIYARLREIVQQNPTPARADVGVFTSLNRSEWSSARTTLLRNPANAKNLELIDSAMFVVTLDEEETFFDSCKNATDATRMFLSKSSNRWWDKSFSVNVSKNGSLGVAFEHAWGDGVAVLRYTQDVFNDSISRSSKTIRKDASVTEPVNQLSWTLSSELEHVIAQGKNRLQKEIDAMDFYVGLFDLFGKTDKIFKGPAKPDPFMQVAMQLAWWRMYRSTVSTYESASTAAFLRGRTECIRSATIESQKFTLLMDSPTASPQEKVAALIAATDKHAAVSKDAKMGGGIDRHLFALRKIAERRNSTNIPELFSDESYKTFGSNMLSTSSLYSDALLGGGFGPVSPGYGLGYASADPMMLFNISAWKQSRGGPAHSCEEFFKAITQSVVDMRNLLDAHPPAVAKK